MQPNSHPLSLNGRMDDPAWQNAEPVSLVDAVSGQPGAFATTVRLLYDDTYLYVGFTCEDDYVWSTVTERDGPVWEDECVEVFLNPSGAKHQYFEINLSPKNVLFDACVLNHRTAERPGESFEPLDQFRIAGIRTAVHVDGDPDVPGGASGWSAEYAIPFESIYGAANTPPIAGDTWRINLYRIDSPTAGQRDHYAWSPTGRVAFHLPWRFGYLEFR